MNKTFLLLNSLFLILNGYSQSVELKLNEINVVGKVKYIKETSYKINDMYEKLEYFGYPREYFIDKSGNLTKSIYYYYNGNVNSINEFDYDETNRLVRVKEIDSKNDTSLILIKYINDFHADRYKVVDGNEIKQFEYFFNEDHLLEKNVFIPSRHSIISNLPVTTNYYYDTRKRLTEELIYNGKELIDSIVYEYDDNGYKWSRYCFEMKREYYYYNQLDSFNNKISLTKLDKVGNKISEDKWSFKYDTLNNWYRQVWIMMDNTMILTERKIVYYE